MGIQADRLPAARGGHAVTRASTDLVVGDWGGSRLRLWRVLGDDVVGHRAGPGVLGGSGHADAFLKAIGDWRPKRTILCGMAGARGALCEVPYVPCPASAAEWAGRSIELDVQGFRLRIAAGFSRVDRHGRPDVMRGEETQVFGAVALDPTLARGEHLVVLPGTHSKWVRIDEGRIAEFDTFMTGELFASLAGSSLFASASTVDSGDETEGFSHGLARADHERALSASLFEARAAQLVAGRSDDWAKGFVSGLLIGAEISEMAPQGSVLVIGAPELAARYDNALGRRGAQVRRMDADACAIAGLRLLDDD